MNWNLDIPQLPFKKPRQIEDLEQLSPAQRDAMDFQEIEERLDLAADSLVQSYKNLTNSCYAEHILCRPYRAQI
jgi:hypothetical protein